MIVTLGHALEELLKNFKKTLDFESQSIIIDSVETKKGCKNGQRKVNQ